jgi:hypothetical protein
MNPTWHRRPTDGKLVLVLAVSSSLDDGAPDSHECAVVEMTPEYAQTLLTRIGLVEEWKQRDSQLQCAQFWNYDPEYFALDWESGDEGENTPAPLWNGKGDYDGRTDTDRVEVGQSGYVEWRSYVKNTDILLVTHSLDKAELERYIAGDNPWPTAPQLDE